MKKLRRTCLLLTLLGLMGCDGGETSQTEQARTDDGDSGQQNATGGSDDAAGDSDDQSSAVAGTDEDRMTGGGNPAGAMDGGGDEPSGGDVPMDPTSEPPVTTVSDLPLRDAPEDIEQGCAEWALDYCAKLEACDQESYFNIGLCTYEASRACHGQVGLAGSALDVVRLAECSGQITGQDCAQFLAEIDLVSLPWGDGRYIQRCAEPKGELENGELCVTYHQCRSGACERFITDPNNYCYRCVADYYGQADDDSRRPQFEIFEAEGDPATDGACTNPYLEDVDGSCVRIPPVVTTDCEGDACELAREGEYCHSSLLRMSPPCEPGTFCAQDCVNAEQGGPGVCVALEPRSDEPNPDAYVPPRARIACMEEQLGVDDRRRRSTQLGNDCTHESELDPSYAGSRLDEIWIDKELGAPFACVVDHFQGRISCPYGQQDSSGDCTTPAGDPVEGSVQPQSRLRVARTSVYQTCRCDGDDQTDYYCTCPDGFSCERLTESIGVSGWASFCVRSESLELDLDELAAGELCDATLENCGPLPEAQ